MILPLIRWRSGEAIRQSIHAQGVACVWLAFFLAACSPSTPNPPTATEKTTATTPSSQPISEEVLGQGQGIYEQVCATCHFDGHGSPTAPSLADSTIVKTSPEKMITQILRGSEGMFKNNAGQQVKGIMPAQNSLSNDDIAAVITYVRHQFGSVDQLTTPAEVAAKR
jgi:mono/diheme cytochrome c family protein